MALYESVPSTIEAVEWTGDNFDAIKDAFGDKVRMKRGFHQMDYLELRAGKDGAQKWVPVPIWHWIVHPPNDLSDCWPIEGDYFVKKYRPARSGGGGDTRGVGYLGWPVRQSPATDTESRSVNHGSFAGLNPPYRTIVADPPWPVVSKIGAFGRRARETPKPYSTMTLDDIERLPVGSLAADPAVLWLWVTPRLNREGVGVRMARAWGFTVSGELVWKKPNLGMGRVPRMSHEIALICTRGKGALDGAPRNVHSVQEWPQLYGTNGGKTHSAKPSAFFDLVQSVSPGTYLELFSRAPLLGWDHWGYGYEAAS